MVLSASLALVTALVLGGGLDDLCWSDSLTEVESWSAEPSWVGNPSPTASVQTDGKVACFTVDEPGRGMKWSRPLPAVSLAEFPYLVVRYRAENLKHHSQSGTNAAKSDYVVYIDDGLQGDQLHALRPCDIVADGQWHVAAVDLSLLTRGEGAYQLAVHVQASSQGKARFWLDEISFQAVVPEGAGPIQRGPVIEPQPDWTAPLAKLTWKAEPSWLANPAGQGRHSAERREGTAVFRVTEPGHGMKWACDLPAIVTLEGHHYATLRYRAENLRPYSDYALCGMGQLAEGGGGYRAMVPSTELISDGRWHTLSVDLRPVAAELTEVRTLAVQVQAVTSDAVLEVAEVGLVNARPRNLLADALDWRPGARLDGSGIQAIPIGNLATGSSQPWQRHLRMADWFGTEAKAESLQGRPSDVSEITAEGVPFAIVSGGAMLAETSVRTKSELRFPVDATANEVFLLVLAVLAGPDEPAYGQGTLRAIRDVDRFLLRLEYADGTCDTCLPLGAATRQFGVVHGPQVMVAPADPARRLKAVVLCDRARQAAFGVLAVSVRTEGQCSFPEAEDRMPVLPHRSSPAADGKVLEARLAADGPPRLERLVHLPTSWSYLTGPCPIVELEVDGQTVPVEELVPEAKGDTPEGTRWYKIQSIPGVRLGLEVKPSGGDSLAITACVENRGDQEHKVALVAPTISYRLAEKAEQAYYLMPKRGAILDSRPCSFRERYCGHFPLQLMDTFAPAWQRGLALRTEDTQCLRKHYLLEKDGTTMRLAVKYPVAPLEPGEIRHTVRTIVTATNGDWHRALADYRRWVATWYQPQSVRKSWFREVFNFRQRFLWSHDPLYDASTGELDLGRAVDEARREFGGIDYLHLFDWGNCGKHGRIYGRVGDYSPYDYLKGGREALRKAIAGVQADGVPVGLYIEGYLLQEHGKLGQAFGKQWQMIGSDGQGRYWPNCSEMYVCAAVPAWREVQAATYGQKVEELNVDGMYLDEYGFAGPRVDCWSKDHGHPVPSYAVTAERDATRMVRQRIDGAKQGVALYSEETPCDVTTQYQDGSFTYAMLSAHHAQTLVPLNLTRFAIPDFKTIEILYCDKPTGSWATGVKWVFFNGEAIWLEGPATEWFEPETRATIRRCYAILHEHRDAFTSLEPVPLVPTELGGVFANAFPARGKTVYTLYNARRTTVRGGVLRVPHDAGARYIDAWHERSATVRIEGSTAVVQLEIGPCDVGCLVVERPEQ